MKILILVFSIIVITFQSYSQINIPDSDYVSMSIKKNLNIPHAKISSRDIEIKKTTNKAYLLPISVLSFTLGWYYLDDAFKDQSAKDSHYLWRTEHLKARYESAKVRNMMVGFSFIAVAFINTIIALEPVEVYSTNNGAGIKYSF